MGLALFNAGDCRRATADSCRVIALPALLAAGLAFRLVCFLQLRSATLFRVPILDAATYHTWAMEIAAGDWLGAGRGVFYLSPGYPYFLGVLYATFGTGSWVAPLAQYLLGTATGALVFLLGRRFFTERVALVGAALYLFNPLAVFYESLPLKPALLNALTMASLVLAGGTGGAAAAASGALLGLSAHLRPTALVLAPVVVFWLWRGSPGRGRRWAFFLAGVLVALAPVAARNLAVGGELVWTTAHGGMNLYTGNSPEAQPLYAAPSFSRANAEGEMDDFLAEARRRSGRDLTPAESSRFWYGETARGIARDPARWLGLLAGKAVVFFSAEETPINLDFDFFRREHRSLLSLPLPGFGVVMPLALVGIVCAAAAPLLLGSLAAYLLAGVLFFVVSEYRFPVVPLLSLYAGAGLLHLAQAVRRGARAAALPVAVLAGAALLANLSLGARLSGRPVDDPRAEATAHFNLGTVYEREGDEAAAARSYERAVAVEPHLLALVNLAALHDRRGETDRTLEYLRRALERWPNSSEAWNNLGAIHFNRRRDYPAAADAFRRAVQLNPNFTQARRNLARAEALVRQGR